jgi:hypothetical protein
MGRLDVRICEARNLPDPQIFGMPDPYVKIKLENQKHKTSVINNCVNPKWEEVFKFIVADENSSQLKLELWNSNVVRDDFLGEYVLSLSGLQRGVVRDEWFLLKQCKTNSEIRVRILAVDFGLLPPAGTTTAQALQGTAVPPCAPAPYAAPVPVAQPQYIAPQPTYPPQPAYPPQQMPYGAPPAPAPYGVPPAPAPYGAPAYPGYAAPPPTVYPPPAPGYGAPAPYPPQQPMGYAQPPMGYPAQPPMGYPAQPPMGYPAQVAYGLPPQTFPM